METAARGTARLGAFAVLLGGVGMIVLHWLVFFWVPTEVSMGLVQRILYVHAPAAWVAFFAFGIVAVCSAMYLWLGDDRLDQVAVSAAEGGLLFATFVLISGPLWGRIAWGTWWEWDVRLTLTLLLWFIYAGYFMVRSAVASPEKGRRYAAVVGIVGALDIPLIHMSVYWFRTLHPDPVVVKPEGPTMADSMFQTLMVGVGAFTLLFLGLLAVRYRLERLERAAEGAARVPERGPGLRAPV